MPVTTQYSAQLGLNLTLPKERVRTTEMHGRLRLAYFDFTQSGVGDANSIAVLTELPAGRVRVLRHLSSIATSAFGAGRTLDIGHNGYTAFDGTAVAAAEDQLVDGRDVAAAASAAPAAAAGADPTVLYNSRDGVEIRAKVLGGTIPAGATIKGVLVYVMD